MAQHVSRSISLVVAFIGAVFNFVIAVRLLALWGSLRWEQESEWEGSPDSWRIDPVKLIWGLLSVYFAAAATASTVGFIGIARVSTASALFGTTPDTSEKNWATAVRFFRDYTIADFAFIAISTVTVAYTSFSTSYVRTGVCEELSRQPELMRDIVETGLSLDNCEFWFERAVVVLLGMLFLLIAVRLHFVIALSKYYSQLRYERIPVPKPHTSRPVRTDTLQRIYLLPTNSSVGTPFITSGSHSRSKTEDIVVYAPVPLGGLSEQDARDLNATEAWISTSSSTSQQTRSHRHTHSHPHPHSHSTQTHRSRRNSAPYQPPPSSPPEEKLIDTSD